MIPGFDKSYDSWRSMDYLHEVAPLVAACNRLVPLPDDHLPTDLHPVGSDVAQPQPAAEALTRHHFRPLNTDRAADLPPAAPNSDRLLCEYAVGTCVEMLYSEGISTLDAKKPTAPAEKKIVSVIGISDGSTVIA